MKVIKREIIKLPHKPKEIVDDSGADELRCAVIRQALEDYEDGILWNEFVNDRLINNIAGITESYKTYIYNSLNQVEKQAKDAKKFLDGSWCRILAGNLDVSKLIQQTEKNADTKIEILSTPCKLYKGTRKNHELYKEYNSLYEMQIDILKVSITPTYFLLRIRTAKGKKYLEFIDKRQSYYVKLGW